MSTVQRHSAGDKTFQISSNINRFQQSSAQYWQALPNPKALATKREALFKLPLGVNINQSSSTFKGCSLNALWVSKIQHLDSGSSGSSGHSVLLWIVGLAAMSLRHHIHTSNKYMPAGPVNERLPSNTPNKILRAPVIDIVGLRCLYVYLFLQMQSMCYVYKKYMYSLVTSKACTGGHILGTTECNAKWGTCWALLKPE